MADTRLRKLGQAPNRLPVKWEIWDLDLVKLRAACPALDCDPDKDSRPYLVWADGNYIARSNNATCIPLSGESFIQAFEASVPKTPRNGLDKDSYAHCHSVQTIEVTFLSSYRGKLDDLSVQAAVKSALRAFLLTP